MSGKEDEHCEYLVLLFEALARYQTSCTTEPFDSDECKTSIYMYLDAYGKLHALWREGLTPEQAARMPFHVRPKTHLLQHLAEEQLRMFGSPAMSWCYRDEDFVGSVKRTAQCSKHPATLEVRCMEKLRILAKLDTRF
jgi:hypothetical protein